jgi:hypothetical protein
MITEDYFLRMINQLAYVLASVLKQMKLKRFDEALEEIQASSKQLLGMDLRLLTTLSDTEFIRLLSLGERFDVEKCVVIGELLKAVGDVREQQGREDDAFPLRSTALSLLLELSGEEYGTLPQEYYAEVTALMQKLASAELPLRMKKKVFRYYEKMGKFDKAEDVLFEIVDEDVTFADEGTAYYDRLRAKTDEQLRQGNLPREELEDSMADLRKMAGKS